MPPRFGAAPKCARCDKSVFIAEQVIGPASRPYHKTCLTCISCGKRLDSTLLVEHDGSAMCKNCHKAHLGQGKGGFSTAVPMKPHVPTVAASSAPTPAQSSGSATTQRPPTHAFKPSWSRERVGNGNDDSHVTDSLGNLDLTDHVPEIRVSGRGGGVAAPARTLVESDYRSSDQPPAEQHRYGPSSVSISNNVRSIDEAIQGSYDAPSLTARQDPVETQDDDFQSEWQPSSTPSALPDPPSTSSRGPDTIGSVAAPAAQPPSNGHSSTGLPPPRRAQLGRTSGVTKVADPAPARPQALQEDDDGGYKPGIGISRLGLAGSIANAKGGTPLCARCEKPVYFAEQRAAAGRKWHRACLRCDGCSTTLEAGKLEEGPPAAADAAAVARIRDPARTDSNIWCRVCYAKHFGPRGIGVAGMSLPEAMGPR